MEEKDIGDMRIDRIENARCMTGTDLDDIAMYRIGIFGPQLAECLDHRSSAQNTLGLASLIREEHTALWCNRSSSGYAFYLFLLHDGAQGTAPLTLYPFQTESKLQSVMHNLENTASKFGMIISTHKKKEFLTYGSEACTIKMTDERRPPTAEMLFMRRPAGYFLCDHKRNEDILKELKVDSSQFMSDAFPIHCVLKQGDALSSLLFNFVLEYAIRKVQDNRQGLELNGSISCRQEVKRRIAMAKGAFHRKRSTSCGPLKKELRLRLVRCFVWSVALYGAEAWTLRLNDAETDQEEKKELAGSLTEKNLPTEECTGKNGEREKNSGQKKTEDDRRH
ncbi:hypothetical protein ANN_24639 [Periplaneta americana]|uniref:Uncharacterized protein n=1 Tax=Periplaneta americana TaxID=6978 RepID=A0ABQ8S4C1_PERAM|nr:hypothetical protein ANN_24639 [Periplaneta americana]